MRKDSIDQKAIEAAYLIFSERGIQTVDFSHPPTDYRRNTVEEPEVTSKLKDAFNELLPENPRNAEFNRLAERDDQIEREIEVLQQGMKVSRQRGAFQQLQAQMKQMYALIKEKERIDSKMSVANLGAAQMDVYNDSMQQNYSEIQTIQDQIASLEAKLLEYRESLQG
jgi:Mg2+ and Co2+ transporter CorA